MTIVTTEEGPARHGGDITFKIEISDETFEFRTFELSDPIAAASQIAEKFGAHPLPQFKVMNWLASGEIETKRPTETTDLRDPGKERFFVIRGDRTFDFSIDGLSLEWPLAHIPGAHLRVLARARDDQELVRVTPQGFKPVTDEETVSLADPEVEEFRLVERKKTVTVFYREKPFVLEDRKWATEQLITVFGVPSGHKLDLIKDDGEFKELKPDESIKVHDGMEFTSHVPAGQSS